MVFKMPEQAEGLKVAVTKTAHLLLVGLTVMGKSLVYMLPFSSVLYDLITWWQLSSFPSFCCMQTFHSKLSMVPTTLWTSEDINNVCLPWAYPNKEIPWVYPIIASQTWSHLSLWASFFFQPLNHFCTKFQKQRFLSCHWWQLVHCLSPPHCLNVFSSKRERDEPDPEDWFGKKIMRDWVLQKSACWQVVLSSFLNDQVIIYTLLQNVNLWYLQKEDGGALPKVLY